MLRIISVPSGLLTVQKVSFLKIFQAESFTEGARRFQRLHGKGCCPQLPVVIRKELLCKRLRGRCSINTAEGNKKRGKEADKVRMPQDAMSLYSSQHLVETGS